MAGGRWLKHCNWRDISRQFVQKWVLSKGGCGWGVHGGSCGRRGHNIKAIGSGGLVGIEIPVATIVKVVG